ncbi:MAG: helix-turn-helix domain-containing protein [Acidimicrobiia bacterium]
MREPGSDLSILFDLFAAGQRAKRLLALAMAEAPLRPEEYAVYSVMFDRGPSTPTEMARILGMPVTTVLDHIRAMTDRGHVERSTNPRDGRSYLARLTNSGLDVHQEAARAFDRAMVPLARHLGPNADGVRRALSTVEQAMDTTLDWLEHSN